MTVRYTTRPLSDRTWLRPEHERKASQFSATWSDTLDLLIREVFALQESTMPDPVSPSLPEVTVIDTTDGRTLAAIPA